MIKGIHCTHNLTEVARLADVPKTTIYEAVRCGRIAVTVSGIPPEIIVYDDDLRRYISARGNRTPEQAFDARRDSAYISLAEAARRYDVNHRTLCDHATKGMLKHVSTLLGDQEHRLTTDDWVRKYLTAHRNDLPEGHMWVADAAVVLSLTPQRVYQLANLGDLNSVRVGHRLAVCVQSVKDRHSRYPEGGVRAVRARA